MSKKKLGIDVLTASQQRISYVFDHFENIYLSFSGGKDSTVMLHLVMEEAIKRNRKIGLLFIDWEIQYQLTIDHIQNMFDLYKENIIPFWVALPFKTESSVSQFEPEWICWDPSKKDTWVRKIPESSISDESFFPFYSQKMSFEEFIIEFGKWYAHKDITNKAVGFVGIRTDESLNRLLKISVKENKDFYEKNRWLLNLKASGSSIILAHPIYDWKTQDIWVYNGKFYKPYNQIYDLMYKAGVPVSQQRIDEFFGSAAKQSLSMLKVIEPEMWSKVTSRIVGCNFGALYSKDSGNITGNRKIEKPEGYTWQSFVKFLLSSMPSKTSEHYKNKIFIYVKWYQSRGYPDGLPEEVEGDLHTKDDHPSWRRICKVLLRNDYWCRMLSFSPTKASHYDKYLEIVKNRRSSWKM